MMLAALLAVCAVLAYLVMQAGPPPMLATMREHIGSWVFVQLRAHPPSTLECHGRLVSADLSGFVLETLDARKVTYQVRPREVLSIGMLPGQQELDAKWAENQQTLAAEAVRH